MRIPQGLRAAAGAGGGPYVGDIAVAHNTSPFISVYPWTGGTGFGTKYSNPATLPNGTSYTSGNGFSFSVSGKFVAVAVPNTPNWPVYPWSAGFGTKQSAPANLPAGVQNSVKFF